MWSITQLRLIPASPPPCAVTAEFACVPDFPSVFFDAGPDLHAETASNASPAAARTPRLRNALLSVENVISILLKTYPIVTVTSLPLSASATRDAAALFAEISRKPVLPKSANNSLRTATTREGDLEGCF